MTKSEQINAMVSLTKVIGDWIDANCNNYNVGFWYDGQASNMAEVAVLVLAASSHGQKFADDSRD